MSFCIKCGAPLQENDKFCVRCGQPVIISAGEVKKSGYSLKSEQMAAQEKQVSKNGGQKNHQQQGQAVKRPVQYGSGSGSEPPKKDNKAVIIGIVAAVLVAAIGVGAGAAVLVKGGSDQAVSREADVIYEAQPIETAAGTNAETNAETAAETVAKKADAAETKKETEAQNQVMIETKKNKPKETTAQNQVTIENKKTEENKTEKQDNSPYPGQKFPYSSEQYLSSSDLAGMSRDEIQLSINDIYARHGYIFKDDALRAYYQSQSWYNGTNGDMNAVAATFNSIEKANVELLSAYAH